MGKYDPLRQHLMGLKAQVWRTTFTEIEAVLGARLPASARLHSAWWANEADPLHPQKLAWRQAGWRTAGVNITGQTIEFVRAPGGAAERREAVAWPRRPDLWLDEVLKTLAAQRPVFHSEADFQHALAWAIHEAEPRIPIRLEYKPLANERLYVDIWLGRAPPIALELKYPTRALDVTAHGERFRLRDQSAQDVTRYDFLKDVVRVERIAAEEPGATGFALLLTNDRSYWLPSSRPDTVDAAFRLHEGRLLTGKLAWAAHAGAGTTKARERPIVVRGHYDLAWRRYAHVGAGSYGELRYLLVAVD